MAVVTGMGRGVAIGVLAAGVLCVLPERAAHAAEDGLFGEWGGIRTALREHGFEFDLTYTNEAAANAAGGGNRQLDDADQWYFWGALDLEHLLALRGGKLIFSITDRNGDSLSTTSPLNTLLEVQEIYGEGNWTRLNQLYWQQKLFDDRVEFKFGRLTGTFDFMPFNCQFQNITFCATLPSHDVAANWVAFPGSTWAGIIRVSIARDWYLKGGVYEVNPAFQEHRYRFAFGTPFGGPGKRVVGEAGWQPEVAGVDGGYRIGVFYDDVGGPNLYFNTQGQPLTTQGGVPQQQQQQSGYYAMVRQSIWAPANSASGGLSFFANFLQVDPNIDLKDQIVELGFFWLGPWSRRPHDEIGIALGRTRVSDQLTAGQELYNEQIAYPQGLAPRPIQHAEYPNEIYYSFSVDRGVTIRPNVQFIHAPGGIDQRSNVLVLGLHSLIVF